MALSAPSGKSGLSDAGSFRWNGLTGRKQAPCLKIDIVCGLLIVDRTVGKRCALTASNQYVLAITSIEIIGPRATFEIIIAVIAAHFVVAFIAI